MFGFHSVGDVKHQVLSQIFENYCNFCYKKGFFIYCGKRKNMKSMSKKLTAEILITYSIVYRAPREII